MADIAGEILQGRMSIGENGALSGGRQHDAEDDRAPTSTGSTKGAVGALMEGLGRGADLEVGGASNRSRESIGAMIQNIDAGLNNEPQREKTANQKRSSGMER